MHVLDYLMIDMLLPNKSLKWLLEFCKKTVELDLNTVISHSLLRAEGLGIQMIINEDHDIQMDVKQL